MGFLFRAGVGTLSLRTNFGDGGNIEAETNADQSYYAIIYKARILLRSLAARREGSGGSSQLNAVNGRGDLAALAALQRRADEAGVPLYTERVNAMLVPTRPRLAKGWPGSASTWHVHVHVLCRSVTRPRHAPSVVPLAGRAAARLGHAPSRSSPA